jgi:hypothetical protein
MRYTFTGQVVRAYITGQLIGPIWQGQTCTKPFSITLTGSITDALEKVRKDGDFQHVEINHAILTVVWADERWLHAGAKGASVPQHEGDQAPLLRASPS